MKKNAPEIEFDNFNKLTYKAKLKYWDTTGTAFYYDVVELKVEKIKIDEQESEGVDAKPLSYIYDEDYDELDEEETLAFYQQEFAGVHKESDNLILSIRPNSQEERVVYNKWVIDHWRKVFQKEKLKISKNGFHPIYKSSDELVSNFKKLVRQKSDTDRQIVISNQLLITDQFIRNLKIKDDLIERVYLLMKSGSEDDLYYYNVDVASTLTTLKYIGQVWDRLKFKVFLENEATLPPDIKNGLQRIKSIEIKDIHDDHIRLLFDGLLDSHFIHEDTKYLDFKHIILQSQLDKTPKIRWIDIADNKEVNKIPLVEFVDQLVLGDIEMKNGFIMTHFNTYTAAREQEITRENLKQSRKQLKNQKAKSDRQNLILALIKSAKPSHSQ